MTFSKHKKLFRLLPRAPCRLLLVPQVKHHILGGAVPDLCTKREIELSPLCSSLVPLWSSAIIPIKCYYFLCLLTFLLMSGSEILKNRSCVLVTFVSSVLITGPDILQMLQFHVVKMIFSATCKMSHPAMKRNGGFRCILLSRRNQSEKAT